MVNATLSLKGHSEAVTVFVDARTHSCLCANTLASGNAILPRIST
jgi:hypothetical protein